MLFVVEVLVKNLHEIDAVVQSIVKELGTL